MLILYGLKQTLCKATTKSDSFLVFGMGEGNLIKHRDYNNDVYSRILNRFESKVFWANILIPRFICINFLKQGFFEFLIAAWLSSVEFPDNYGVVLYGYYRHTSEILHSILDHCNIACITIKQANEFLLSQCI